MTPHRLYKLDYGVPVGDLLVGLGAASASFELYKLPLDDRLALPLCALTGAAAFLAWLGLKGLLPRHFVPDLADWLLQPATYRATRDDETPPLLTDPEPASERGDARAEPRRVPH